MGNKLSNKKFTKYVINLVKGETIPDLILNILRENGFLHFGMGDFKEVFEHPSNNKLLVKVYLEKDAWKFDSYRVPKLIKPYYLKPLYRDKFIIIQPKANGLIKPGKNVIPLPEMFYGVDDIYDVWGNNIQIHNGREVIIDFLSNKNGWIGY